MESKGVDCESASLKSGLRAGEGVKGVEKGWAADVDVAAGGFAEDLMRVVVEIVRVVDKGCWWRTHLRQIIFAKFKVEIQGGNSSCREI